MRTGACSSSTTATTRWRCSTTLSLDARERQGSSTARQNHWLQDPALTSACSTTWWAPSGTALARRAAQSRRTRGSPTARATSPARRKHATTKTQHRSDVSRTLGRSFCTPYSCVVVLIVGVIVAFLVDFVPPLVSFLLCGVMGVGGLVCGFLVCVLVLRFVLSSVPPFRFLCCGVGVWGNANEKKEKHENENEQTDRWKHIEKKRGNEQ